MYNAWDEIKNKYIRDANISNRDFRDILEKLVTEKNHKAFFAMLYFSRNALSTDEIVEFWSHYIISNKTSSIPWLYIDESTNVYKKSKLKFYSDILMGSELLLDVYFVDPSFNVMIENILNLWIEDRNWNMLQNYVTKLIKSIPETSFFSSKTFKFLTECSKSIEKRFDGGLYYLTDYYGRETADIVRERENEFVEALVNISIALKDDINHTPYHYWLKSILKKTYRNLDALNATCLNEVDISCVDELIRCIHRIMLDSNLATIDSKDDAELYYCIESFEHSYQFDHYEQTEELSDLSDLLFQYLGLYEQEDNLEIDPEEFQTFYDEVDYMLDYFTPLCNDEIIINFFFEHYDDKFTRESFLECMILTSVFNEDFEHARLMFDKLRISETQNIKDNEFTNHYFSKNESLVCSIITEYILKRSYFWSYNYSVIDNFFLDAIEKIKDLFKVDGLKSVSRKYENLKEELSMVHISDLLKSYNE